MFQYESYVCDLMWWHTLQDDDSLLGYATALDFARRNRCGKYLDFGSGVGSGQILLKRLRRSSTLRPSLTASSQRFIVIKPSMTGAMLSLVSHGNSPQSFSARNFFALR